MSYGMMIAVQMDKKTEFDAIWNWAYTHTRHASGPREGYFGWQARPGGSLVDANSASDGEEYFATALFFAAHRWGNGEGIYDYEAQANQILNAMLHKEDMNGGVVSGITNMFNVREKQVVFVPYAGAASYTDPSYHLPAFYELWGRWAEGWNGRQAEDRQFWLDAAETSRRFFMRHANPNTGLTAERATFSAGLYGSGNLRNFASDAVRSAMNWAVDYAWWADDPNEVTLSDRILAFFESQGVSSYVAQYQIDGTPVNTGRSTALVAANGAAALAGSQARSWRFVEALWQIQPPSGQWRYYDGLITYMALLHASGNFRVY